MVKPLSFKGDKKTKKRKRTEPKEVDEAEGSAAVAKAQTVDDDDGWVNMETDEDLKGPIMLTLVGPQ